MSLLSARLAARAAQGRRPTLWQRLSHHLAIRRQRRDLAQLDDHLLADIGLTREMAQAELDRALWDVPAHWRR